jgi:drug/metabolite transporter (DMT)-like permease
MQSLWMLAASLLFASMGVCVKLGSQLFSAAEMVFYRGLVGTVVLLAFIMGRRLFLATPHWRSHLYRSLAGLVALLCYFESITRVPLATAVTLSYTSPLFLALLLAVSGSRRHQPRLLPALAAGFVGVVLLLQPTLSSDAWLGGLFGLASGVMSGFAYLNVSKLGELGEPEWRIVFYFSLLGAVGAIPWTFAATPAFHPVDLRGGLLLLGVGGFALLAQLCMTRAYRRGKTLATASLAYSTVVFSSFYGMLLWNDRLPLLAWLGIGLIVVSGLVTTAVSHAEPVGQD